MANVKAQLVKEHREIYFTADADYAAGNIVPVGATSCGVVVRDVKSGGTGLLYLEGLYQFPVSSLTISAGAPVYWDATNGAVTGTATSNVFIGTAVKAIASTDTTALVDVGNYFPAQTVPGE